LNKKHNLMLLATGVDDDEFDDDDDSFSVSSPLREGQEAFEASRQGLQSISENCADDSAQVVKGTAQRAGDCVSLMPICLQFKKRWCCRVTARQQQQRCRQTHLQVFRNKSPLTS
jgi:hypothetical protein